MKELIFKVGSVLKTLHNSYIRNYVWNQIGEILMTLLLEKLMDASSFFRNPDKLWKHFEIFIPSIYSERSSCELKLVILHLNLVNIMKFYEYLSLRWDFWNWFDRLRPYRSKHINSGFRDLSSLVELIIGKDLLNKSAFIIILIIFNLHFGFFTTFFTHCAIFIATIL